MTSAFLRLCDVAMVQGPPGLPGAGLPAPQGTLVHHALSHGGSRVHRRWHGSSASGPCSWSDAVPTALITGIAGQDGAYLSALLRSKGYRVVGMVQPGSTIREGLQPYLAGLEILLGD